MGVKKKDRQEEERNEIKMKQEKSGLIGERKNEYKKEERKKDIKQVSNLAARKKTGKKERRK